MHFYSTSDPAHKATLQQAVVRGLAPNGGLYMPEVIPRMPDSFFKELPHMSFQEISYMVAKQFAGDEIPSDELRHIIESIITFDAPCVPIAQDIFTLELFHGPTLAFKDFGARFMSRLLGHFAASQDREITILVATSGDTGSAVANGFLDVPGTRVVVLYPSGKVSPLQEKQFTTLGKNIMALEVEGTFDDCQRLVKQAFSDATLMEKHFLTSANSINIARLIPQMFYYFHAWGQLPHNQPVVFAVPSGNFGNLTAGLMAKQMGLPIDRFVAATNVNDTVPEFLKSGTFTPKKSVDTMSNAMDVGNPSNFARMMDLYDHNLAQLLTHVTGYAYTDAQTSEAMKTVYDGGYMMDPHGAVGYLGLQQAMAPGETGVFLETAHPAKFKETVEETLQCQVDIPDTLKVFMDKQKSSVPMSSTYGAFHEWLTNYLG